MDDKIQSTPQRVKILWIANKSSSSIWMEQKRRKIVERFHVQGKRNKREGRSLFHPMRAFVSSNSFVSPAAPKRFSFSLFHLHHPINYHSTVDVRTLGPLLIRLLLDFLFCSSTASRCVLFHSPSHSRRCRRPRATSGEVHGSQFAERLVLLLRGKRWTLRCLDRWSLRANFFSQTMHWYGFTPEWERRWRDSSSERENLRGGQTTSLVALWFDCGDEDDENCLIIALKHGNQKA